MKKSWKRSLSLFLSAVLAGLLLPAAALAEEAAPQPLADTPEHEYVQDTDGVDSGAVYAIYTNVSPDANNRILYHTGTGMTDKVGGSVTEGKLSLNGSFSASRQLWTITAVEGGYTVQSVDSDYYLDLTQARASNIDTSEDSVVLTIELDEEAGTYTIQGSCALSYNGNGNIYAGTEAASLRFFKQTEVTDPVDPEPEEPATGAPEIPGYTQYTSETLDPSKYYLIVTEDSDGNLYALYLNQAGTQVSSGGLTGTNGACTAALTVDGNSVSAAYLADNTALEMDDLRITVNSIGEGYTFRSGDLGLTLSSNMFSAEYTTLSVSVSDGMYSISSSSRLLSFNRNGDTASQYPNHITDFWGPNGGKKDSFPIYLYTQDAASVPVDKSQLQSVVDSVSALEEKNYTTDSWATLQESLDAAQTVLDDSNATQSEVNEARDALTSAIAALEYVVAPPAELPTATQYIQDTDGVDDGAVYAIYTNVSPDASNRILYHTGTGKTDKVGGTVSGDTLALNGTFSASTQLWTITAVDGGYTVQSIDSNYYLDLTQASTSNIDTSQTPVTLTIGFDEENGTYTISQEGGYTFSYDADNNGAIYAGSEAASLRFFKMTEVETEHSDGTAPSGTSQGQPFVKADTGSNYFRIPSLITLDNGWIVATADIRWRTDADSPQNLDTIVSVSKDGGETWEWEVVNYFDDMADTSTGQASASFIDPSVLQASDGTVHLVVDACPSYCGLMSGNRMGNQSSGFDAQGRMIVALAAADGDAPTNPNAYDYYVDINNSSAGQTITVDGEEMTLYPICSYTDDSESGYYVDAYLDLYYKNGDGAVEAVYCVQLNGSVAVQSNLFYRQSQWKAYPVFYIMHRSATVTEDGLEWSEPQFLDIKLSSNEAFTGVCPGRGTVVTLSDGTERLLFPLYDNQTGTELASVIYSDDGGQTWTRGNQASDLNGTGKSSESQIVVLPDGNLRMYSRNTINYISYADSTDGGKTWGTYQKDESLSYVGNCMVSFLNLEGTLTGPDGTVYENLILASYPKGSGRNNGVIRIGYMVDDEEGYPVHWLNDDTTRFSGSYSYSCLTQLASLDTFGLLYEYDNTTGTIGYVALTVTDLLGEDWTLAGDEYTITYQITGDYFADDAYATQTVRAGETVTALAAPVQSGYTFHGWTGVPEIMPGHDVTVTGYFTRDSSGVIIPTPPVTTTPDEDEEEIGDEDTPLAELPFTDVAADAWYADAVAYAVEHGLMNGTSASTFSPLMTTDRAMIVTILYRLEGEPAVTGTSAFSDVADGQWYTDAVIWAADNGIVTGYDTGAFGPGDTITREQMAAILYRYASYKGYDVTASADLSGYADQAQISAYALTAMQWANAEGLITGTSDSTLTPGGSATRAEAATILMRFAQSTEG